MKPRGVHLQYSFEALGQSGAEIHNPLFELLSAVQQAGSIGHAARQLHQSYRHVWGSLKRWEEVLGSELVVWAKGQPARLTPFAERLVWAERQARTRLRPHVEALRAELSRVFALADDSALQLLEVFASHDLGLPRLQRLAEDGHALHLSLRFAGSQEALRCLMTGRCTVAGFHVPRGAGRASVFARTLRPLLRPGTHKLIGSHTRCQGLMLGAGLAQAMVRPVAQTVAKNVENTGSPDSAQGAALLRALAAGQHRFVNRQQGSGTRLLLEHLLAEQGLTTSGITGYDTHVEETHVAVAAAVAAGAADVGLGVEAAAREFGLAFMPLVLEDYYLVCLKAALDTPSVLALRQALASTAWATALQTLPGYGPQHAGEVLSLTRALPWWRYRSRTD